MNGLVRILAGAAALVATTVVAAPSTPNIVVILADDLGYGDVHCYNPERGKIPTPRMDGLAAEGMRFTDAHSSSGVCSPSRYALLTGRYHWRTRLQRGIVGVFGDPLIAPDRLTIAGMLKPKGYATACIGKWHLGRDWGVPEGEAKLFSGKGGAAAEVTDTHRAAWRAVFSKPFSGGPTSRGFDEYFGTDVPNWPPYCFIENERTVGIPTEFLPKELFQNHLASLGGPALPGWDLSKILPALADRACAFVERESKAGKPFFLYMPLTAPHTPIAVNPEWRGKSGLIPYADFVMETDAAIGRVLDALAKAGAADRTLVVLTSDNGCAPYIGAKEMEAKGHFPSGPLRGYKADAWEGGHRVPFIVRWPGVVKPGGVCGQLVHQADLIATFADALGVKLPETAAEDSFSLMPLLRGGGEPVREGAVSASAGGIFAVRKGSWKLIPAPGGGGNWSEPSSNAAPGQLYNLAADLGEKENLYGSNPDKVAELTALLQGWIDAGRSTPGAKQTNDVPVEIRKPAAPAARPRAKPARKQP
ncbi:MAG: arylsulfatase [Lentisphaerae bacterium]|nr:arylsulfatase [Lentisphaerota bacterium]